MKFIGFIGLIIINLSSLSFANEAPTDWESVPEYRVKPDKPVKPAQKPSNDGEQQPVVQGKERVPTNNETVENKELTVPNKSELPVKVDKFTEDGWNQVPEYRVDGSVQEETPTEQQWESVPEYRVDKKSEAKASSDEFQRVKPAAKNWEEVPEYRVESMPNSETDNSALQDYWDKVSESKATDFRRLRARGPKFFWVSVEFGGGRLVSHSDGDYDFGVNFHFDLGNNSRLIGISRVPGIGDLWQSSDGGGTEVFFLQGNRRSLPVAHVSHSWGITVIDAEEPKNCRSEFVSSSFLSFTRERKTCRLDHVFPLGVKMRLEAGLGKFVGAGFYLEATVSPDIIFYNFGVQMQYGRFN